MMKRKQTGLKVSDKYSVLIYFSDVLMILGFLGMKCAVLSILPLLFTKHLVHGVNLQWPSPIKELRSIEISNILESSIQEEKYMRKVAISILSCSWDRDNFCTLVLMALLRLIAGTNGRNEEKLE